MATSKDYAPVGRLKLTEATLVIAARACRQLGMHAAASNMPLFLQAKGYSVFEMGAVLSSGLAGATAFTFLAVELRAVARARRLQLFSGVMCLGVLALAVLPNHRTLAACAVLGLSSLSLHPNVSPQIPLELSHLRAVFESNGTSPDDQRTWLVVYHTVNTLAASAGALAQTVPVWLGLPASHWMVLLGAATSHAASVGLYRRLALADDPLHAGVGSGVSYGATSSQTQTLRPPVVIVSAPQAPPSPQACLLAAGSLPQQSRFACAMFAFEALAVSMVVPSLAACKLTRGVGLLSVWASYDRHYAPPPYFSDWMHGRYGLQPGAMGPVTAAFFFLATCSLVAAPWVARRFGARATLLSTHAASSVLLLALPFCEGAWTDQPQGFLVS
jgi:hypothetical protein